MHQNKHHQNYHLGTWGFPSTGWWVMHAFSIAAVFYWGYKMGQEKCEEDDY